MRRTLALFVLLTIVAFCAGCSSSSDTNIASNANANVKTSTAPPATAPAAANSAPAVGGAAPPQARPTPSTAVGIKPPTKNQ